MNKLAYELITQIASRLDHIDVLPFMKASPRLYSYSLNDSFWLDLCRMNQIRYIHPDITYRTLYLSGDIPRMCQHVKYFEITEQKKESLWSFINKNYQSNKPLFFCLHSPCNFIGGFDEYEHHIKHHSVMLKLSMLHILELWCHSCKKAIGIDGFPHNEKKKSYGRPGCLSERHIMKWIMRLVTSPATKSILEGRRRVEYYLCLSQYRFNTMHIIDKKWYSSWLDFIMGNSDSVPDQLHNGHLFKENGVDLRPDLVLGEDIELINGPSRWYLERVYGDSRIISTSELPYHDPEYCSLIHRIKLRTLFTASQRRHYPPSPVMLLEE